jgi:hypothetical protein
MSLEDAAGAALPEREERPLMTLERPGARPRPERSEGWGAPGSFYFLPAFFLPAMVLRGPLLERAFVLVR